MSVHVIADTADKLSCLRALLQERHAVTSELLGGTGGPCGEADAVVVAADLRSVENIAALKELSGKISGIARRIFLVDQKARLLVVQAYALGATRVLGTAVRQAELLAQLADATPGETNSRDASHNAREAASAGAIAIGSMFSAVLSSKPIDVRGAKGAGSRIADSIAEDGLSSWLETVRRHHEGTYQHCLLVAGIATDFGLSLGLAKRDIGRLTSAAMFHDIGKAKIPLAILDKPGRLDAEERALIETHPSAGWKVLKGSAGISPEILDAVRHHHEYLDGSGYPDGLCAASIPDIVRMLTISDIFSALIEHRSYRPTMSRERAYEILQGMQGKLEMPLVADAFRDVAGDLEPRLEGWAASLVHERGVVEIDRRELVLLGPVVLAVLPFRLVAALGQQVHVAHHVAGIEILRIDPGQQRHVVVFRPQRRGDLLRALLLHVRQQAADEIRHQIGAQRPAGAEIAEHPDQVRHAGEHHAAIGDGIGEIQRLAVDRKRDVAEHAEIEPGRGDDDVGLELVAGFQENALFGEAVDLVGDDRGLAALDALEQVGIGNEGDALPPRPVFRREMLSTS